ncbi:MAG TPA: DUF5990 family protein [Actinomycetes bacterium]
MGTTSRTTVALRIVGHRLPGLRWTRYQAIHLGVQRRPGEVVGLVPGDADAAVFDLPLDVVTDERGVDFRGPFVQGRRGERFLYLSWGEVGPGAGFEMFRRAKLQLGPLAEPELAGRLGTGSRVEASLDLTDANGGPRCASVRPPIVRWQVVPAEEGGAG